MSGNLRALEQAVVLDKDPVHLQSEPDRVVSMNILGLK